MSAFRTLVAAGALLALTPTRSFAEDVTREHVSGDIYHYSWMVQVGDGPNGHLRLHRVVRELSPFRPRPTHAAAMLMHGDFSSFTTNFMHGVAPHLAGRNIDVWGFDRRWATAPVEADLSDFGDMGLEQELDDTRTALAEARARRAAGPDGDDRMALAGFSRGGLLAYAFAAAEADRPANERHVNALVALDVAAVFPPEDEAARAFFCEGAAFERELLEAGVVDSDNFFFIAVGELALSAPDDPSPFFDGFTNRDVMLLIAGQTYFFFPATPLYHLAGGDIVDGVVTGLRESAEADIAGWFANAVPHQALREAADTDELWCTGALPVDKIRVPLLYLGAAGGYGDHGLYTTELVGSHDVTTIVVRRLDPSREAEDFGHGDELFGTDAAALVWEPLADWIQDHR